MDMPVNRFKRALDGGAQTLMMPFVQVKERAPAATPKAQRAN